MKSLKTYRKLILLVFPSIVFLILDIILNIYASKLVNVPLFKEYNSLGHLLFSRDPDFIQKIKDNPQLTQVTYILDYFYIPDLNYTTIDSSYNIQGSIFNVTYTFWNVEDPFQPSYYVNHTQIYNLPWGGSDHRYTFKFIELHKELAIFFIYDYTLSKVIYSNTTQSFQNVPLNDLNESVYVEIAIQDLSGTCYFLSNSDNPIDCSYLEPFQPVAVMDGIKFYYFKMENECVFYESRCLVWGFLILTYAELRWSFTWAIVSLSCLFYGLPLILAGINFKKKKGDLWTLKILRKLESYFVYYKLCTIFLRICLFANYFDLKIRLDHHPCLGDYGNLIRVVISKPLIIDILLLAFCILGVFQTPNFCFRIVLYNLQEEKDVEAPNSNHQNNWKFSLWNFTNRKATTLTFMILTILFIVLDLALLFVYGLDCNRFLGTFFIFLGFLSTLLIFLIYLFPTKRYLLGRIFGSINHAFFGLYLAFSIQIEFTSSCRTPNFTRSILMTGLNFFIWTYSWKVPILEDTTPKIVPNNFKQKESAFQKVKERFNQFISRINHHIIFIMAINNILSGVLEVVLTKTSYDRVNDIYEILLKYPFSYQKAMLGPSSFDLYNYISKRINYLVFSVATLFILNLFYPVAIILKITLKKDLKFLYGAGNLETLQSIQKVLRRADSLISVACKATLVLSGIFFREINLALLPTDEISQTAVKQALESLISAIRGNLFQDGILILFSILSIGFTLTEKIEKRESEMADSRNEIDKKHIDERVKEESLEEGLNGLKSTKASTDR